MAVEIFDISSLQQLVETVLKIRSQLEDQSFLWYRGISCSTYKLLPGIMRDNKNSDEVFKREERLLTRFRQRSMAYWPDGYPQTSWEHLFAMQHHGIPTRLLDWSENLFVATYFALSEAPKHTHEGPCVPVLWCMDPVRWNRAIPRFQDLGETIQVLTTADDELGPYSPEEPTNRLRMRLKSPVAIYGSHNSKRIVAQRGTFVVWGSEVKPLDAFASEQEEKLLWRFNLVGERDSLYHDLQTLGFSETMVYPELTALAKELAKTEGWR